MAVRVCGRRIRGDWKGILTCVFILCCWTFAVYCFNLTIIPCFFENYKDFKTYLQSGHIIMSLLTLITMVQCIISDAGQLYNVSNVELLGWEFCDRCQKYRPPRSHHCRRCGHCVRKMDHHCPWINNCVGEDNVANFTQFLFYTALMSWPTVALCASYFMEWLPECTSCIENPDIEFSIKIEMTSLTVISLAFGAFTTFMFIDRMVLISADVTSLELMSDKQAIKKSCMNDRKPSAYKLLSRTFGSSNVADWLMPYSKRRIRPSYEYDAYNWLDYV